jgi:hypothetical protein
VLETAPVLLGEEGEAVHVVREAWLRQKKRRIGKKDEKPEKDTGQARTNTTGRNPSPNRHGNKSSRASWISFLLNVMLEKISGTS